jgi:hypothetical protein
MKDRDCFKIRAAAARAAAIAAKDVASCRIHMDMAKEYEFRAAMEPDDDDATAATDELPLTTSGSDHMSAAGSVSEVEHGIR